MNFLKGLIDLSNSLCTLSDFVPLFFLGPARIPLVISRGRHSSRNNVRCPPSLLVPYLLMNLLARSPIICVLCLGFDYELQLDHFELLWRMLEHLIHSCHSIGHPGVLSLLGFYFVRQYCRLQYPYRLRSGSEDEI